MNRLVNYSILIFICFIAFSPLNTKAQIDNNPAAIEALSKCLAEQGATMFGKKKCGHCKKQKEMFGSQFKNISYVDCDSDRRKCIDNGVGPLPKWIFSNGKYLEREQSLDLIAKVSNCEEYVANALDGTYIPVEKELVTVGETEPENLARCLKNEGVLFFGSPDCGHCKHNKEMFNGAFEMILQDNFKNCLGADKTLCKQYDTYPFPTWYNPSTGAKLTRPNSLEEIARAFSCTGAANFSPSISRPATPINDPFQQYTQPTLVPEPPMVEQENIDPFVEQPVANPFKVEQQPISEEKNELIVEPVEDVLNDDFAKTQTVTTPYEAAEPVEEVNPALERLLNCVKEKNLTLYYMEGQRASQEQLKEIQVVPGMNEKISAVNCGEDTAKCDGIIVYPTWIINNEKQLPGVYEIRDLSKLIECQM